MILSILGVIKNDFLQNSHYLVPITVRPLQVPQLGHAW